MADLDALSLRLIMAKVLIISTTSIGGVMHGMQVAATLKENDPELSIHLLARDRLQEIIEAFPFVEGFIPFKREGGFKGALELRRLLRARSFDYVLDFHGLARTGLMSWICRSPRKIGRADAREGATIFYKQLAPLPSDSSKRHTVDKLLEFCRVFGFEPELKGRLAIPELRGIEKDLLKDGNYSRIVSIVPNSLRPERRWNGMDAFIERLDQRLPDARLVLLGLDHEQTGSLSAMFGDEKRIDLRARASMLNLARILQVSDLVVGVDNDFVRLASALGSKTLTVIGKSNILYNGPYPANADGNRIVYAPKENLALLSVEEALEMAESQLFS